MCAFLVKSDRLPRIDRNCWHGTERIDHPGQKIADASASRGRAVFTKTCAACHVLYGEGGKIGPDLTGSNRANLDYILLNSVDPSYDVPAGYRMVTIVTVDGRVVSGVIAEEDETRIVLKTVEQPKTGDRKRKY